MTEQHDALVQALQSRVEQLEAALKPFADALAWYTADGVNSVQRKLDRPLTQEDIWRAAETLGGGSHQR